MKTIQGFILIDVDVAALNNAGGDKSTHLDNAVMTKKIRKNGKEYPYVSGQAWRYWWRESLVSSYDWKMSPVIRESKIAFTEADPFKYPDDDVFGYMRAGKKEFQDPETGKTKKENITLTRISPLKNSALISVCYNPVVKNWASMTRQEGDAVPYGIDEYCAIMKGMFSIAVDQVGTFSMYDRTGYVNINQIMKQQYIKEGAIEIDDPILKDKQGNAVKLIRMDDAIRLKRIQNTVSALKTLSGGAKQATNMADVTPKLIILAQFKSGNHPFSHIVKDDLGKTTFSIEALKEIMEDYAKQFDGKIFIGRRKGFMDEIDDELNKLKDKSQIEYGSVNSIIDSFINQIKVD